MNLAIQSQGLPDLSAIIPQDGGAQQPGGFAQVFEKVNTVLENADQLAAGYAQGKVGMTEAVIASSQADTTFQLLMAVRNRALSAYQEIMNLQI
jgi:flagellar hook-basal body complex protein FliE